MKAIRVYYKGATNTKGARLIATTDDHNRVTIPYPTTARQGMHAAMRAAEALCLKHDWHGTLIGCGLGNEFVFVWEQGEKLIV